MQDANVQGKQVMAFLCITGVNQYFFGEVYFCDFSAR